MIKMRYLAPKVNPQGSLYSPDTGIVQKMVDWSSEGVKQLGNDIGKVVRVAVIAGGIGLSVFGGVSCLYQKTPDGAGNEEYPINQLGNAIGDKWNNLSKEDEKRFTDMWSKFDNKTRKLIIDVYSKEYDGEGSLDPAELSEEKRTKFKRLFPWLDYDERADRELVSEFLTIEVMSQGGGR